MNAMKTHHRIHYPLKSLRLATLGLLLGSAILNVQANDQQKAVMFEKPPTAHELADILFPAQGRSIVIDQDTPTDTPEAPKLFGMMINFEFGTTRIIEDSLPFLDSVGEMLNLEGIDNESIVIEGHTDAVGTDGFNAQLSEQRALAVKRYLVSVHAISENRLHPLGKGESELYDSENPRAAVNRRVQFRPLAKN